MSKIKPKLTFISKVDACNIAEPFGEFQYQDAQGDVRHEFANAVIARHERIRAAAPELLEALKDALAALAENVGMQDTYIDFDQVRAAKDKASAAIAKATGETP
jgi:hypothetical protein